MAVQFEDAWERKDIEFDADLEDAAYTQADPGLLELVWTNLLSNAVKFTPDGGRVKVRSRTRRDSIVLMIADTGIGIAPQSLRRLGQPFEQVERRIAGILTEQGYELFANFLKQSGGTR